MSNFKKFSSLYVGFDKWVEESRRYSIIWYLKWCQALSLLSDFSSSWVKKKTPTNILHSMRATMKKLAMLWWMSLAWLGHGWISSSPRGKKRNNNNNNNNKWNENRSAIFISWACDSKLLHLSDYPLNRVLTWNYGMDLGIMHQEVEVDQDISKE